jgi:hypothetical protein
MVPASIYSHFMQFDFVLQVVLECGDGFIVCFCVKINMKTCDKCKVVNLPVLVTATSRNARVEE